MIKPHIWITKSVPNNRSAHHHARFGSFHVHPQYHPAHCLYRIVTLDYHLKKCLTLPQIIKAEDPPLSIK